MGEARCRKIIEIRFRERGGGGGARLVVAVALLSSAFSLIFLRLASPLPFGRRVANACFSFGGLFFCFPAKPNAARRRRPATAKGFRWADTRPRYRHRQPKPSLPRRCLVVSAFSPTRLRFAAYLSEPPPRPPPPPRISGPIRPRLPAFVPPSLLQRPIKPIDASSILFCWDAPYRINFV